MTATALPGTGTAIAPTGEHGAVRRYRTIRGRLITGLGGATIALVTTGIIAVHTTSVVARELRSDVHATALLTEQLSRSHDATLQSLLFAQGALVQGGAAQDAATFTGRLAQAESLSTVADSLRQAMVLGAAIRGEERAAVEHIGRLQGQLEVRLAVARAYRGRGRSDAAFRQIGLATASLDTLLSLSTRLSDAQRDRAFAALARIDAMVVKRRLALGLVLSLGLAVALVFGIQTWRAVARPLRSLTGVARSLGGGDLRATIDGNGLDAEYRVLVTAFDEMAKRMRAALTDIQREAREVTEAASALEGAASQAAQSTGQISSAVIDIAERAGEQRDQLTSSRTTVTLVESAASSLSDAASRSRQFGAEIQATAERTREGIAGAVSAAQRANGVLASSSARLDALVQATKTLGEFVQTIEQIAGQSSLLALNAAIEAARSGEHGRGFAVVAEEIRKLASHSEVAAADAMRVVEELRQEVGASMGAFRSGVSELGDVNVIARKAEHALGQIDALVAQMNEIAGAVGETARQSHVAVATLDEHLRATERRMEAQATSSQTAAASAEETAATVEEVAATAHELSESASRLKQLAARFQV
ncbi:MAG TPA: methyl-accepting chemotaxis protein [Gemmatimonadaceae bacterium]|nr:methyl-accepting chemotaxis protein [Gemmatimonadaceae bacterium]